MEGASRAYQNAIVTDGTLRTRIDVFQHGQLVDQLTNVYDGMVTADTTAPRLRSCTVSAADPNGSLTQGGVDPFTTKFRPYRGAVIQHTTTIRDIKNDTASWTPGTHIGTAVVGGALTMA